MRHEPSQPSQAGQEASSIKPQASCHKKKRKKGGADSGKGGEKLAKCCRQLKGVNGRLFYEKLPKREWHPEFFLGRGITQRLIPPYK